MVFVKKKKKNRFEVSSVVNCRSFPRQLTTVGLLPRQLTIEGYFRLLHVFFSPIKCVNNNFPPPMVNFMNGYFVGPIVTPHLIVTHSFILTPMVHSKKTHIGSHKFTSHINIILIVTKSNIKN